MEELNFSELRKIQKEEARTDELSELGDKFLLRFGDYLDRVDGVDDREYRNAKRIFDKIISLREDKIVKNAKLSIKSKVDAEQLNMLPREQELYRELKQVFEEHRGSIDGEVNGGGTFEPEEESVDAEEAEEIDNGAEGYESLEITSHVPEFMGTDLEEYGPFEEGDEVEVPEENAEILVNRGSAERKE
jgi:DNA replication initiation complex subunit (GINS family)